MLLRATRCAGTLRHERCSSFIMDCYGAAAMVFQCRLCAKAYESKRRFLGHSCARVHMKRFHAGNDREPPTLAVNRTLDALVNQP
jgi:hypothetical protein